MHILNVMLGAGRGGIEQASLDYARALKGQGVSVLSVLAPGAAIAPAFERAGQAFATLRNFGPWDWLARRRLHHLWRQSGAALALAHGNRALSLLAHGPGRVVSVLHNYRLQHLKLADAAIGVTPALAARAVGAGLPSDRVLSLSNMLEIIPPLAEPGVRQPPVIGAFGRFVPKKGFAVFLDALALLRDRDVAFRARLGGGGDEEQALRTQAAKLGLDTHLDWQGWVEDKAAFFRDLDVFCVPSLEEPFGIVMLEAFAHGVAVVAADAEGPQQIVGERGIARLCRRGSPQALADALQVLLADAGLREGQRQLAHAEVSARYAMPVVGARLAGWLATLPSADRSNTTNPSAT